MAGFSNDANLKEIVYADNVDFSGGAIPAGQMTTDGQLLIGSSVAPNIRSAVPTNGTNISWTTGHGTLRADISGQVSVSNGGTGDSSFTAYSIITGGITSTGALQNVSGVGTSGQVLTSNGPSQLPTWQSSSTPAGTPPIGALSYFATSGGTSYPGPEWLKCDGSIVSQATYTTLFSRIGLLNGAGTIWNRNTPHITSVLNGVIAAIAYGNSTYVRTVQSSGIETSTDGITWTFRTSGTTSTINSITYGTVFVFGTNGGGISTSTDGITWTARTSNTSSNINSLAYGNSTYVGCGAIGALLSSTDAITWTVRKTTTSATLNVLAYGNGNFVAAGNAVLSSTDGTTWNSRTADNQSSTSNGNRSFLFANSLYLLCGNNGLLSTSTDGVLWTARNSTTSSTLSSLGYGGNYVVGGAGGFIASSTDGVTWTSRTSNTTSNVFAQAFGNSTYVYGTASGGAGTSTDGTTWTARATGSSSTINSITYGTVFSYVQNGGGLFTSTDGITFTSRTSGTSSNIYSVLFANNLYVYGGAGGVLATSTDSITWTARTSGVTTSILSLTYGSNYVLSTANGLISSSTDAITWTSLESLQGSSVGINTLGYNNNVYYAFTSVNTYGQPFTSSDANIWYSNNYIGSTFCAFASLTYGTLFVGGSTNSTVGGIISTSTDGITWSYTTISNSSLYNEAALTNSIIYANNIYTGVGSNATTTVGSGNISGNMISSTDGISWYNINNGSINSLSCLVYGDKYVACGGNGETLTSSGTYSYNSATSFQLPNDSQSYITNENSNNFIRNLYIRAL